MIRLAEQTDLSRIMEIVDDSVKVMNEQGNFQWDHTYPTIANYQKDLDRNELFVYEQEGKVFGTIVISEKPHREYPLINWSLPDLALTLKRLAVDPRARGRGISNLLFQYAEKLAMEKGFTYLKTDTFSQNEYAQNLFIRNRYQFVQKRQEDGADDVLYYFEKALS